MENELTPLSADDAFTFGCNPGVACFNECCRDLNQFLTPYDILRLKNHLNLSSSAFLERYTRHPYRPRDRASGHCAAPECRIGDDMPFCQ